MKKVIIFILNFILVVLLTVLCIITIMSKTVLNKNYIETSLVRSNFYNELDKSIQNEFDTYLAQIGAPSGILNGIYTIEELKENVSNTLDAIYNNKAISENTSFIIKKIETKAGTSSINIERIINNLADVYNKKVIISSKYVNAIGQKMTKIISIVNKAIIAIAIVLAVLLIIMCAMIANVKVIINHLGILLCTSGILGIIIKIFVGTKFNYIFLLNTAFSEGLVYIINNVVDKIMSIGIGLTVIRTTIYNMWQF